MERIEGVSIEKFRGQYADGIFPMYTAVSFGIEVVKGLKKLHSLDIVHGDIHSGNVLLQVDKETKCTRGIKFVDFGRALRSQGSLTPK
jgi:serine/threonine protein kinase